MRIKKLQDAELLLAGDQTRLRELFHPEREGLDLPYSLAHAFLEPGTGSLPHRLRGSELYYFLRGRGVFYLEGQQQEVGAETLVWVPPMAEQWVRNTGTERLEFLCIVAPPWTPEGDHLT